MSIQSVCVMLAAQLNVSWLKEVSSTELTKEFMSLNKLSGSPKLSKQLIKLGVEPNYVSLLLGNTKKETCAYKLWENNEAPEVIVRLQGNSTHFLSCQSVDNPSDPDCWIGGSYSVVEEDLVPYYRGQLFFITFGNAITEDGKGWQSRAKLRLLVNEAGEKALFLDRSYGNSGELLSAAIDIATAKGMKLYASGNYYAGKTAYLADWEMPSEEYGYQDSGTWRIAVQVNMDSSTELLRAAYLGRKKSCKAYSTSLSSISYNPQNHKFSGEEKTVPSRALARLIKKSSMFTLISKSLNVNVKDVFDLDVLSEHVVAGVTSGDFTFFVDLDNEVIDELLVSYKGTLFCVVEQNRLRVVVDVPELGFYPVSFLKDAPNRKGVCNR